MSDMNGIGRIEKARGIAAIGADISRILDAAFAGDSVRTVQQLPNLPHPAPLKKSLVAVGLRDANVLPSSLGDFAGVDESGGSVYGRALEVTASMLVCAPPACGAAECQRVFGIICDSLLFLQEEYSVTRIWCEDARYDKELSALALPCFARLKVMVTRGGNEAGVTDFIIRRVNT